MPQVNADMLIGDVLNQCPGAAGVFERHGLACGSCLASGMESLSAVADIHEVSLSELIDDLNALDDSDCDEETP